MDGIIDDGKLEAKLSPNKYEKRLRTILGQNNYDEFAFFILLQPIGNFVVSALIRHA